MQIQLPCIDEGYLYFISFEKIAGVDDENTLPYIVVKRDELKFLQESDDFLTLAGNGKRFPYFYKGLWGYGSTDQCDALGLLYFRYPEVISY